MKPLICKLILLIIGGAACGAQNSQAPHSVEVLGTWIREPQRYSENGVAVESFKKYKIESNHFTLIRNCVFDGSSIEVSVSSPCSIDENQITLHESNYRTQYLNKSPCSVKTTEGAMPYSIRGKKLFLKPIGSLEEFELIRE